MNADLNDVTKGRVFMLNPQHLKGGAEIGAFAGVNPLGGNSPHYFLCVGREGQFSYWCPLSSKSKKYGIGSLDGQGKIPRDSKLGFTHFMAAESWFDTKQIWRIQNKFVLNAANVEYSNRRSNEEFNHVATTFIESIFPGTKLLE